MQVVDLIDVRAALDSLHITRNLTCVYELRPPLTCLVEIRLSDSFVAQSV